MAKPWLTIIGIGADGWEGLGKQAQAALEASEIIFGSERQLRLLPEVLAKRSEAWSEGIDALLERLRQTQKKHSKLSLLASGDPMWHGLGASLCHQLEAGEFRVFPAVSSRSLAAARLGWSLQEAVSLSLHNRPVSALRPHIAPRARLLLLSRDADTPAAIARELCEQGYSESIVWVLEYLGGERERIRQARADAFALDGIADLNLVAVEVSAECEKHSDGVFGIADDSFNHDGNITRREIRAVALARLGAFPGAMLWDVGAGSGSLSVEWMRLHRNNRAIAIEAREDRCRLIEANRDAFGVPELEIRTAKAPEAFAGLPSPDAIFVGGGVSNEGLLQACWRSLRPGGRLVAHAVSLEGEAALQRFRLEVGGEMLRIGCERLDVLGSLEGWRPARAVVMLEARR